MIAFDAILLTQLPGSVQNVLALFFASAPALEGEPAAGMLVHPWKTLSPALAICGAVVSIALVLLLGVPVMRLFVRKKLSGYPLLALSVFMTLFAGPVVVQRLFRNGIASGDVTGKVALTVLVLCASGFLLTLLLKALESHWFVERLHVQIPAIFLNLVSYIILLIVLVVVTQRVWNTQILAGALTASAAGSVIAGFALKDTLSSFFSGIALVSEHTLRLGDWILVKDVEGEIVSITWRTVLIKTRDGDLVMVPHAISSMEMLKNFSRPTRAHALYMRIGVAYEHPPSEVKKALTEAVLAVDRVAREPPPHMRLVNYNDFAIDYEVKYWVEDYAASPVIKSDVMTNVWYAFRRHGIKIPFPIREITIQQAAQSAADDQVLETLKKVPIFAVLEAAELHQLSLAARVHHYGAKEYLIRQGEAGDSLLAIVRGAVDVRIDGEGASRVVASLGSGQFVGEMALLSGEPRSASVLARSDVVAVEVSKEALAPILQGKPEIADSIARIMALRKEGLDEARASALVESERRKLAAQHKSYLGAITRFFGLPSFQS